ncbi:hypothetical protein AOQ84DRAFT_154216 [Glonium stellatum]|uniref:Uncharacterized protein n=1 Tax=Glonium stellatum TaxID=574774 RepID=A0A8E2ER08_9PEZI|nr:hypothetical protein AOQ84DRAFT_154216 [Glonium stellatum]
MSPQQAYSPNSAATKHDSFSNLTVVSKYEAPIKETIYREFHCEYPKVHTHVTKIRDALPFPGKLGDVIAWTDAFVERIAFMAHEEEHKASEREKTIRQVTSDRDSFKSYLENQKRLTQAEKDAKKAVQDDLRIEKKKNLQQATTIKNLNDRISKNDKAFKAMVASFTEKLTQAGKHDDADHKAMEKLNEQLAEQSKELQMLQDQLDNKKGELTTKTEQLETLKTQLKKTTQDLENSEAVVKSQKETIAAANAARDIANGNVDRLQTLLEQAQKHAESVKKQLETTEASVELLNAENIKTEVQIANLKADLDKSKVAESITKQELEQAKENAKKALDKAKEDLDAANESKELYKEMSEAQEARIAAHVKEDEAHVKVDKAHAKLDKARADELNRLIQTQVAPLNAKLTASEDAFKKLQNEHNSLVHDTANKVAELEKKLETTNEDLAKARNQLESNANQAEAKRAELDGKLKNAEVTLASIESRLIEPAQHRKGERINILSVEYGGKEYTEDANRPVYDRLYKMARENSAEMMNNKFFSGDPWHLHCKSFSITYQVDGKGNLLHGYGKEDTKFRFKLEATPAKK